MRINGLAFLAASLIPVFPALAQQQLITGVYARSPEQCAEAKKDFQAFIETGETVLTARGIEGIEYNCEFVDWKQATRSLGAVATMLCEEPGYAYPEIYAVMPRSEGELEFTLPLSVPQGETPGNYGTYYLCEGVEMP
jgi:hypothetical protein